MTISDPGFRFQNQDAFVTKDDSQLDKGSVDSKVKNSREDLYKDSIETANPEIQNLQNTLGITTQLSSAGAVSHKQLPEQFSQGGVNISKPSGFTTFDPYMNDLLNMQNYNVDTPSQENIENAPVSSDFQVGKIYRIFHQQV